MVGKIDLLMNSGRRNRVIKPFLNRKCPNFTLSVNRNETDLKIFGPNRVAFNDSLDGPAAGFHTFGLLLPPGPSR
jgi:hypothetical protein